MHQFRFANNNLLKRSFILQSIAPSFNDVRKGRTVILMVNEIDTEGMG